jgi:outer membrane protein OmpA-like peptidoglycan-associated protein/tetratricopeptide (TPR) repeat protein
MNKNLLVILFIAVSNILISQKPWKGNNSFLEHFPEEDTNFRLPNNFAAMGDLLYNNFEFKISAEFYEQSDTLNSRQLINHSLCYYNNNDFASAIYLFEKALNDSTNNSNPNINLFLKYHYAVSLKNIHEFEKSKELFNEFYIIDSSDLYINLQLASIDSLMKWDSLSFVEKITPFSYINSASSEFSTSFYDDGIFYITENGNEKNYTSKSINIELGLDSLNKEEKAFFLDKIEGFLTYGPSLSPRTSVYEIHLDFNSFFCSDSSAEIPNSAIDSSLLILSHKGFNITSISSDFNNKITYYTRHPNMNKWNPEASVHPLIFQGIINEKRKKLTHRKKVHIKALPDTFGSGEVSISADGNTLYFVSDKRKGEGGTDLYVTHKNKSGRWGKAINLGADINTPFDEQSPKIYDDSILYFASNGHAGYGKADIYKCKILGDSVYDIHILPYPINSEGDDLHFDIHPFDESIGLLNSNRSGGRGDEDIYFASLPVKPYVKGYIKLAVDSSIQEGTFVRLMDENNHELRQITTKVNGIYRFSLNDGETYKISATKTGLFGHTEVKADENLFRHERHDIFLNPAITIQGFTIDENDEAIASTTIDVFNEKDSLILKIKTDHNGFFQFQSDENIKHLIVATKNRKVGTKKIETGESYQTDSIIHIKLFNTGASIKGIVIDPNGTPSKNAIVRLLDSNNVEIERLTTSKSGEYYFSMSIYRHYRIVATNYGMVEDTSFYTGKEWGELQTKNLYLKSHPTVQGYTYYIDSTKTEQEVKIDIIKGIDANYISIFSDQNGFYQIPLFNDSIVIMEANKKRKSGNKTIIIDTNYITSSLNNIILHGKNTELNGVVKYNNDSVAINVAVELIDADGKWVYGVNTDSLGKFNFKLNMDKDYEIYSSDGELEAVENIHTGILWDKDEERILILNPKGSATYGKVVDADDQTALSFVKITLTDSSTNIKNITYTNDQGIFEMALRKNNVYTIKLERVNYFPKIIDIRIGDTIPNIIDLNKEFNLDLIKSGFKVKPIYFEFASHEITKSSKDELKVLANILKERKNRTVTISGYTDCRGNNDYNMILGENRASAVKDYLISVGISSKRINVVGKGATNYVNNCYNPDECTEAEHRMNRRCEFQIDD